MSAFARLSLTRQFLVAGFIILFAGMLFVGTWVGKQIETRVISRTGQVTSLYVESLISPHLQFFSTQGTLRDADTAALGALLAGTPLGWNIVAFKLWGPDGRVLYSPNPAIVDRQFPIKPALALAFAGQVRSQIADLSDPENEFEANRWSRLIETYVPVRSKEMGTVVGVAEFYQTTDDLAQEIRTAQFQSWMMVAASTLVMFLLLAGMVRRADRVIFAQQRDLRDKVAQLTALLAQIEQLHERVRRAAARTTALNERFLHRIAADLHDGPVQDLALALMRIDTLSDFCTRCPSRLAGKRSVGDEFGVMHTALQSALGEVRAISAGLRLPEIERMSIAETTRRAVRHYERRTGLAVTLNVGEVPSDAPLPVKITLYRLLQESLANGFRHGGGAEQRVTVTSEDSQVVVEVADRGKGFDPRSAASDGHLGLAGMRERVEILGGTFSIESTLGQGAVIRASLPLAAFGPNDE